MLTARQRAFADSILGGDTVADAYRSAYTTGGMSPKHVRTEASRVHKHPGVSRAIDAGRVRQEREKGRNEANRRRSVLDRLETLADDTAQPGAVRVQALKLIGTDVGLFHPNAKLEVKTTQPETEAATLEALESTLREALEAG